MTHRARDVAAGGYDVEVARAAARSFGWDAVYCAGLGAAVISGAHLFSDVVAVPARRLRISGVTAVVFAGWLGHRAYHGVGREHLQVVAGVNLVAVALLVHGESRAPTAERGWRAGLAVELGAFAARQAQLLHRSHVR
jgi:hypothetical protein